VATAPIRVLHAKDHAALVDDAPVDVPDPTPDDAGGRADRTTDDDRSTGEGDR
jgi:hypothetical protein